MNKAKSAITREYLSKKISRSLNIKNGEAYKYIDKIIDTVIQGLMEESTVKIRLFGNFTIRHKKARIGRNPRTKVEAEIKPRKVIQFKIAPTFKKRVNDNILTIKDETLKS